MGNTDALNFDGSVGFEEGIEKEDKMKKRLKITDLAYRSYRTGYGTPEEEANYMKWFNSLNEEAQYIENLEIENTALTNKLDELESIIDEAREVLYEIEEEQKK